MLSLPPPVRRAISILNTLGYPCHAVGGCVRDLLLGREPEDYDLCTAALPDETWAAFEGYPRFDVGKAHGTVGVVIDGMKLEITTYRTEIGYSDGRHPDGVVFVSDLTQDLGRRDFTVNAMALAEDGEVVDPFDGQGDLSRRLIRCVGDPMLRFEEDSLRVLRALRFSGKLDFAIDPPTMTAMRELRFGLARVARERILNEWSKLLLSERGALLRTLKEGREVVAGAFPMLSEQIEDQARWNTAVEGLGEARDFPLRMAELLNGLGRSPSVLSHEPLSSRERGEIAFFCDHLRDEMPRVGEMPLWLYRAGRGEEGIGLARRLFGRRGREAEPLLRELDDVEREAICFTVSGRHGLKLNGGEVMRMSGRRGAALGELLDRMLMAVLSGEVPNEAHALEAWITKQE